MGEFIKILLLIFAIRKHFGVLSQHLSPKIAFFYLIKSYYYENFTNWNPKFAQIDV
jgi:hypothetical protein